VGDVSRRLVLRGMGCAAMAAPVVGRMISVAGAAEEQGESAICLSMIFVNSPKASFDNRRFAEKHLPLLRTTYGDSIERIELRTPRKLPGMGGGSLSKAGNSHVPSAGAGPKGPPPSRVLAAVSLWLRDLKGFAERTVAAGDAIAKDLAEVTEVQPLVQYDKVLSLLGDDRGAIPADDQVYSIYFPAKEGGTFDAKYYGEKVIPLMVSLYGAKSIRRIEYTLGSTGQGGGKPAVTASAYFYIRDRAAWDAAGMKAFPQLMAEGPKYTTLAPLVADMEVSAAG
jgi:hypothetical protein